MLLLSSSVFFLFFLNPSQTETVKVVVTWHCPEDWLWHIRCIPICDNSHVEGMPKWEHALESDCEKTGGKENSLQPHWKGRRPQKKQSAATLKRQEATKETVCGHTEKAGGHRNSSHTEKAGGHRNSSHIEKTGGHRKVCSHTEKAGGHRKQSAATLKRQEATENNLRPHWKGRRPQKTICSHTKKAGGHRKQSAATLKRQEATENNLQPHWKGRRPQKTVCSHSEKAGGHRKQSAATLKRQEATENNLQPHWKGRRPQKSLQPLWKGRRLQKSLQPH